MATQRGALGCAFVFLLFPFTAVDAASLKLRPYAARHEAAARHKSAAHQPAATVPAVVAPPPVAALSVAAPSVVLPPAAPEVASVATPEIAPVAGAEEAAVVTEAAASSETASSNIAVKHLHADLAEVKQLHGNVVQLEKALSADVSLLRESANLQRLATSPSSRRAAKEQVLQSERMVREVEAMVHQGRQDTVVGARAALSEADAARKAADALAAEAAAQLKVLDPHHEAQPVAALQIANRKEMLPSVEEATNSDTDDDDDDENSN